MTNITIFVIAFMAFASFAFAGTTGPAPIPNPPNFYITSSATALCRGQVNYIPITVTNKASTIGNPHSLNQTYSATVGPNPQMQNVVLSVSNTRGFYPVGNGTVDVGNVNPNTSVSTRLPIFVSANVSSLLSLGIGINYFYYTYYVDTEQRNITLATQLCQQPLSVSISPGVLTAGNTQNLAVNITNTGATTLNTITMLVKFPNQYVAWLGSQQIEVNSLAPGATVQKISQIFVSYNASDEFAANVSATFYNGTNLEQIYQNIEMLASGIINLTTSSITISPSIPTPSSIFSVSFILTNTGTSAASAVTATILPTSGFTAFGSNSVFVGSIGADSQTPVTLTLETGNKTKSGSYSIPIRINYLNTIRESKNQSIMVPVIVGAGAVNASSLAARRAQYGGGGGTSLLTIVLIIVIIVLGYLLYREKKNGKKPQHEKPQHEK